MIGFISWIMAGYIAYVLLDNKQRGYRDAKKLYKQLIVLMLSGWFGLGFVVGRYYV